MCQGRARGFEICIGVRWWRSGRARRHGRRRARRRVEHARRRERAHQLHRRQDVGQVVHRVAAVDVVVELGPVGADGRRGATRRLVGWHARGRRVGRSKVREPREARAPRAGARPQRLLDRRARRAVREAGAGAVVGHLVAHPQRERAVGERACRHLRVDELGAARAVRDRELDVGRRERRHADGRLGVDVGARHVAEAQPGKADARQHSIGIVLVELLIDQRWPALPRADGAIECTALAQVACEREDTEEPAGKDGQRVRVARRGGAARDGVAAVCVGRDAAAAVAVGRPGAEALSVGSERVVGRQRRVRRRRARRRRRRQRRRRRVQQRRADDVAPRGREHLGDLARRRRVARALARERDVLVLLVHLAAKDRLAHARRDAARAPRARVVVVDVRAVVGVGPHVLAPVGRVQLRGRRRRDDDRAVVQRERVARRARARRPRGVVRHTGDVGAAERDDAVLDAAVERRAGRHGAQLVAAHRGAGREGGRVVERAALLLQERRAPRGRADRVDVHVAADDVPAVVAHPVADGGVVGRLGRRRRRPAVAGVAVDVDLRVVQHVQRRALGADRDAARAPVGDLGRRVGQPRPVVGPRHRIDERVARAGRVARVAHVAERVRAGRDVRVAAALARLRVAAAALLVALGGRGVLGARVAQPRRAVEPVVHAAAQPAVVERRLARPRVVLEAAARARGEVAARHGRDAPERLARVGRERDAPVVGQVRDGQRERRRVEEAADGVVLARHPHAAGPALLGAALDRRLGDVEPRVLARPGHRHQRHLAPLAVGVAVVLDGAGARARAVVEDARRRRERRRRRRVGWRRRVGRARRLVEDVGQVGRVEHLRAARGRVDGVAALGAAAARVLVVLHAQPRALEPLAVRRDRHVEVRALDLPHGARAAVARVGAVAGVAARDRVLAQPVARARRAVGQHARVGRREERLAPRAAEFALRKTTAGQRVSNGRQRQGLWTAGVRNGSGQRTCVP